MPRKRVPLIVSACVLGALLIWFAARWVSAPIDMVGGGRLAAKVNGRPITLETFRSRFARFSERLRLPSTGAAPESLDLRKSFLNKLIETELLLQEAQRLGIEVTDAELDRELALLKEDYPSETLDEILQRIGMKLGEWREERRERMLIDKLIAREVDSAVRVGEEEVRAYYEAHLDEFKQPLMVRARQIVVASEEEANLLRGRILKGEDFAELARQHSLSPDAERGGDLGYFAQGQMPEDFDNAVFPYRVGNLSQVVQSPYGYHLFLVEDRVSPRTLSLEEVREDLTERLFQARQETDFNQWMDGLRGRARIKVYTENLAEVP